MYPKTTLLPIGKNLTHEIISAHEMSYNVSLREYTQTYHMVTSILSSVNEYWNYVAKNEMRSIIAPAVKLLMDSWLALDQSSHIFIGEFLDITECECLNDMSTWERPSTTVWSIEVNDDLNPEHVAIGMDKSLSDMVANILKHDN